MPGDAERLRRYDDIVASLIAWRCRANTIETAAGKHLIDASVMRQLAGVYADRPIPSPRPEQP